MAVVGTLAVNIVAKTEKFTKGINKSLGMLGKLSRGLAKATKLLAAFGVAGATAAAGALAALTKSQFSSIDTMAKFSDKVGIGIESLSSLRLAAEETGVSANTLDMALQRMTRRIAEAGVGKGEALGALGELGFDPRTLSRMKPEEQFYKIADAMGKVRNQGDRVRLAMKLFDSEGVALVNTLALGSSGLREYEGIARRLGLTITRDMAAGVERANDAFGRLKKTFVGLGRQLAVRVAPLIEKASQWMESLFTDDGRIHKFANAIALGIGKAIEMILRGIRWLKKEFLEFQVMVRATFAEMMTNPLVLSHLNKKGISNETISDAVSSSSGREARARNQLFKMNLEEKEGRTTAHTFARWWTEHLGAALQTMRPKLESKTTSTLQHLLGLVDKVEMAARDKGAELFHRFSKDPRLQEAIGQLSFGFAGRLPKRQTALDTQRGSLAFAVAGSADSYRQQAAMRRQNEPMMKIAKEQLAKQEEIRRELAKQNEHPDRVANF